MSTSTAADRIRVLFLDASYGFGGGIRSLGLLLRVLGVEHARLLTSQPRAVVAACVPDIPVGPLRKLLNYRTMAWARARVENAPAPLRWFVDRGLVALNVAAMWRTTGKLVRYIRRHRINLVHMNNGAAPFEGIHAARRAGVPCIVHFRAFTTSQLPATLGRHVDGVIAVSQAVADWIRAQRVVDCPMAVVHDPVDIADADAAAAQRDPLRRQLGLKPEHVAVAIFGRVIRWKGQDEFVQAMLLAMQQNENIRALIVGDVSDGGMDYFDAVRERARNSRFADHFIFTGYQADVNAYYAACDIVVHASIEPEPFGMVVPEGMAARRPVIAMDAGGPREVIVHGETGLLVPTGDLTMLAQAVLALARAPEERERLGENGRRYVEEHLTLEEHGRAVRAFYVRVLSAEAGDA